MNHSPDFSSPISNFSWFFQTYNKLYSKGDKHLKIVLQQWYELTWAYSRNVNCMYFKCHDILIFLQALILELTTVPGLFQTAETKNGMSTRMENDKPHISEYLIDAASTPLY